MNERQLADHIAKDIFESGNQKGSGIRGIVQRIAFKGGKYPDDESNLGGYCQSALADRIYNSLIAHKRGTLPQGE